MYVPGDVTEAVMKAIEVIVNRETPGTIYFRQKPTHLDYFLTYPKHLYYNNVSTLMNIFYLDESPEKAALYHCDKHVNKMFIETAQLLSAVHHHFNSTDPRLYRKTHVNHPSAVWARDSRSNYVWLYELYIELYKQYKARFQKEHLTYLKTSQVLKDPPEDLLDIGFTEIPQCMPDAYKRKDPVEAYRQYYRHDKARFAAWREPATIPDWFLK